MPELVISTDKYNLRGWQEVQISMSMDALAHEFTIGGASALADQIEAKTLMRAGSKVVCKIDDTDILTGYVDTRIAPETRTEIALQISGRSTAGDLVDCSAIEKTWKKTKYIDFASEICAPFGIQIVDEVGLNEVFGEFIIEPAETAFEALDRGARMRAGILMNLPDGSLAVLQSPGSRKRSIPLVVGQNCSDPEITSSLENRYSDYIVIGQSKGTDDFFGTKAAAQKATATDPVLKSLGRHRPLTIISEASQDEKALQERADWEARTRASRGTRISTGVSGWSNDDGVWLLNELVRFKDDSRDIDQELLIVGVSYVDDTERGQAVDLVLGGKDSYTRIALPEPKENDSWWL